MCPRGGSPKTIINNAVSPSDPIIRGKQPIVKAETCCFCGEQDLLIYRIINGIVFCLKHAEDFVAGRITINGIFFNPDYEKYPPPETRGGSPEDFAIDFSLSGKKDQIRHSRLKKNLK